MAEKLIADNRKARHDYQLLERVEAGLVLTGTEVKSLREGRATLGQAYADVRDGEAWLHGAEIAIYDQGNRANHEPTRTRKLLLHRREIDRLYGAGAREGADARPDAALLQGRPREDRARARPRQGRPRQAPHARRPRREAPDRARAQGAALMGPKERERVLERLRRICLGLPEVEERLSHGAPTFFVRGKRPFVMVLTDHHGDGRFAIWCAAGEGVQSMLVDADPERFFVPPYVGHRGWLGVRLDRGVDWDELAGIAEDAFAEIAPAKLVAAARRSDA